MRKTFTTEVTMLCVLAVFAAWYGKSTDFAIFSTGLALIFDRRRDNNERAKKDSAPAAKSHEVVTD